MFEAPKHKRNKLFTYWIDIVGTCNLRCPTCPTGNFKDGDFIGDANPTGYMDLDLYKAILGKIGKDNVSDRIEVHLYNWGEPLMHPKAAEFVRATKDAGYYCGISSNLNLDKNLKEVVKAGPDFFRISTSGFYQNTYGRTHRRGDINMVKSNMYRLRHYLDQYGADTFVQVLYHVYRDNADDNLRMMVKLCEDLRYNLNMCWAFFMPVEKGMRYLAGDVSAEDREIIGRLAIGLDDALAAAQPFKDQDCNLRSVQTSINCDGTVQLCCGTYDRGYVVAPSFLDIPHDELQAKKYAHSMCGSCMNDGLHAMYTYLAGPALDEIGNRALAAEKQPFRVYTCSEPNLVAVDGADGVDMPVALTRLAQKKPDRGVRLWRKKLKRALVGK